MKNVIAVYVENVYGVLTRVTALIVRRGFNIDTLTVGETDDPKYSRITITMEGDEYALNQITNQLYKLHNVKKVKVLDNHASVARELMLVKIRNTKENRSEIITATEIFRAKVIDYTPEALTVEVTGESSKLNAFLDVMKPLGIVEMCRTGVVALERGENVL